MTNYEEALNNFKFCKIEVTSDRAIMHLKHDTVHTIIEALEKQIPQVVDADFVQYNNTEDSVRVFICSECTEEVEREWDYCPSCGQKIDWSEEERQMKEQSKPCDRKKCPYYYEYRCPHRFECTHSKEFSWILGKLANTHIRGDKR